MSADALEAAQADGVECRNAQDFAKQRLREAEGIVKPHELAEEYDCTQGHMQETLTELAHDGVAEKVGWGRYREAVEAVNGEDLESTEESGEEIELSRGGQIRSLGTDTGEESPASDGMNCPYENCDYSGETGVDLKNHANAKARHDWGAIKEELDLEDREGQDEQDADDFDDQDDEGDEGDEEIVEEIEETTEKGIPLPVSSTVLIGAAVAVIALLWLYRRQSTQTEPEPEQNQQEDDIFGGSGLMGEV